MSAARRWGVQEEFEDAAGHRVAADTKTVSTALAALGAEGSSAPPRSGAVFVHRGARLRAPLEVRTEDGRELHMRGQVPSDAPYGYHRALVGRSERQLIISPRRCHLSADLHVGGWAVQLYAMRSRASWGFGDLADLRAFGAWSVKRGAQVLLVNPLHAATLQAPIEPSPYLPTSRRFRNPLFLRVEDVPGADQLGARLEALAARGRALNGERLIDRAQVARLKLEALQQIHQAASPAPAFRRWRTEQGEQLELFATFSAIAEAHGSDWRRWPQNLRRPDQPGVSEARRRLAERLTFHAWLQWLIEQQLAAASKAVPLMHDLAIGVDPGGADAWAMQDLFAGGFSVGAPPDLFNRAGQNWGQPPFNPWRLRQEAYRPLIAILRAAFAHGRALRIDHIMGLFRLYWIPQGASPADGVFVRYPHREILDLLALESLRAGAYVVGEDLGTVEPVVRRQMSARDILSYRLLWFEEKPPSAFPRRAMCAATTHDLPTIAGLWTGADLQAQRTAGLEPNQAGTVEITGRLVRAAGGQREAPLEDAVVATYRSLSRSPSMVVAAALEDAALVAERPNMPGTAGDRWPNWRLGLPRPLEDLLASPLADRLSRLLSRS